jgi:signal transduction histidine kinase/CheY-like chemotaxis protein
MQWPQLDNAEALVLSARHNARFGAVRLPVVFIVSLFLWQLATPVTALAWLASMLIVERLATYVRGRVSNGETQLAALHLFTLGVMSALWVGFGILLWQSDTELGRIAATIGLLTTALYGALGGQKDLRVAAILVAPTLLALFTLVSLHAWSHWPVVEALVSSLATFGACASVLAAAWALNRSDATLDQSNRELTQLTKQFADNMALLEQTSEIAQVGGWRLDLATGRLDWTAQTRKIHDVNDLFEPTLDNAIGFYLPADREQIERAVAEGIKTGQGWDLELRIQSARGVEKSVRANGKAVVTDGVVTALLGAFADISQRVRLEEGLRRAQKLESIGRLAGGVAHDFNNVLTAVVNSATLLKTTQADDPRHTKLIDTILKASERASGLTRSLLAFSRQQVLTPQPTDLNVATIEAAELLAAILPSDIRVVTEQHPTKVLVLIDPSQLSSALLNLAVNAKDAMPQGGELHLTSHVQHRSSGAVGAIIVRDTGSGIDPSIAADIFDPFFTTKAGAGGSGLGLAMVHGFVTQSGGEVSVESALGSGTKFTLTFPLLHQTETGAGGNDAEPSAQPKAITTGARILLVDDDDLVRDALALSLGDLGFSVSTAADGAEALRLCDDGNLFDLAIADVVLTPQMSGPQLERKLRQQNPQLKTVLVSGYARDKLTSAGKLGAEVSFLQKPFSVSQLVAHMESLEVHRPQGDFGF